MSQITTHVLDTSMGRPAAGVPVVLEIEKTAGGWKELTCGSTDGDGRLRHLLAPDSLVEGTYRLTFDTGSYFESHKIAGFYPQVVVEFQVRDPRGHYHIPLLLSPYGYSTYRGS
jgi:5-hydroxyisourate hydrolase